ncbi:MAG: SPFH domain-containing protein, partial [Pseudomonadota bacterium]
LSPPQDIVLAMGSQMKAEREKRAEVLTAEGEKQAAILKAEGQKESQIREAEGRREAAFLDAEAREREAEAEAKATQMVSAAISQGDVQAINYFVAQKYTEALGAMVQSPNAKTIILPIEASGIAGAVSGIAELTGALRGGGGGGTTGGGGSGGGQPGAESGGASQGGASRAAPAASSGPSMSLGPWRQNG